jgi:hypothetical protein
MLRQNLRRRASPLPFPSFFPSYCEEPDSAYTGYPACEGAEACGSTMVAVAEQRVLLNQQFVSRHRTIRPGWETTHHFP